MENSTAKQFSLQLGSLISLYVSLGALIQLLFGIITIQYPDLLNGSWEITAANDSIRFAIAMLVVFFPTYIVLTRVINTARRTGTIYLVFMKWLIYLSLLIGGTVLLGDLVFVINNFLNGELTTRFLLKALTVLVVVGSAFVYYVYDARNYWQAHESKSKAYGAAISVLVLVSVIVGYLNIESPTVVRERNTDTLQISDLSTIQGQITNYYALNSKLPTSLTELTAANLTPKAIEGRAEYTYTRTATSTFELCAEFAYPSAQDDYNYSAPMYVGDTYVKNPSDWSHEAGVWCFTRKVGPIESPVI